MMGRVLVTGVGGFVGSYVAKHLASCSLDVVGNYRTETPFVPRVRSNLCLVQADLTCPWRLAYAPFDAVVHCAAAAGAWNTPEAIKRDNISATSALIGAGGEMWNTKLFILLSSTSVYGNVKTDILVESTPQNSPDFYGQSKLECEKAAEIYSQYMPAVALRLPGVIGPGAHAKNWLPKVAQAIEDGRPVQAFNLDSQFNAAVHVADLASFIETLLHRPHKGFEIVNLAAGDSLSVRSVIKRLAQGLGRRETVEEIPATKSPYLISSVKAQKLGYVPMSIGPMIDQYAREV